MRTTSVDAVEIITELPPSDRGQVGPDRLILPGLGCTQVINQTGIASHGSVESANRANGAPLNTVRAGTMGFQGVARPRHSPDPFSARFADSPNRYTSSP